MTKMTEAQIAAYGEWATSWHETFGVTISAKTLTELVGESVTVQTENDDDRELGVIVGHSRLKLELKEPGIRRASRTSLVTFDGKEVPLKKGMILVFDKDGVEKQIKL